MKKILLVLFCLLVVIFFVVLTKGGDGNDWYIYPNPAHDYFNIKLIEGELKPVIKIYDFEGRLVQEEFIGRGLNTIRIDIDLKPGEYFVILDDK